METVPLKDHYDALRKAEERFSEEREKRYEERFNAQEKALDRANEYLKEYKAQANEWRQQSKDREANFLSVAVHETFSKSMNEKIDLIQKSINTLNQTGEGIKERKEGVSATWVIIINIITLLMTAGIVKFFS